MNKIALITGITGQDDTIRKVLNISEFRNQGWLPKIGIALGYNSY